MKNVFKKNFLGLLALLPISSISYSAEHMLHEKPYTDNLKLGGLKLQDFRSLLFPVGSAPVRIDEAYERFQAIFQNYDEAIVEDIFRNYVDELLQSGRLKTDGIALMTGGNLSGIGSPK